MSLLPLLRAFFLISLLSASWSYGAAASNRPNIVFILADDMGYGDPQCFNAKSKIQTPHIDQLAHEGMRFTDAHAPGAVCVPSRYGLLTGRYPFRITGVSKPNAGPLIEPGRPTIATVLHSAGYSTAMIGKWHLGFEGGDKFNYSQPLRGGPVDHGFDSFFGQHASLDIPPYFLIDNDRAVEPASGSIEDHHSPDWTPIQGAFWRGGPMSPSFKHIDVLPLYTQRAVQYLQTHASADREHPFFLYLAFTAPHTPWLPTEAFRGKSLGGLYGDFVTQVDDSVGQVLGALESTGLAKNTLVFFSSDNGPVWYPADVAKFGHQAAGPWRGMKGDAYEAGHRMPFIARWLGHVPPGTECAETICFTDLLATFAALTGATLPQSAGEDSYNLLPLLEGGKHPSPFREATVMESSSGVLTIRQGDWKLIPQLGGGGFTKPAKIKPKAGEPAGQLYNLKEDPAEEHNRFAEHPEIAQRLADLLAKYRSSARSAP